MKKAVLMINHVQEMTKMQQAKQNVAVLVGDDFAFGMASDNFRQMDEIIKLMRSI
jgi:hypothetical protein